MQNIDELKLLPVWADPHHLVVTARHIMAGHHMRVLSVVQGGKLIGTVSAERLAAAADGEKIQALIDPLGIVVEAGTPVRRVAELFVREQIEYAPVVCGDRFLGMATSNLLLRELGRSWDPLTQLPWSDRLREWGAESLKQGKEICILFIDLNDFGRYNKRYGHIVGDRVLTQVARLFKDCVDTEFDVLVRYGGDEFAIGTTRTRSESEGLRNTLMARMGEAVVPEAMEPVTYSVGLRGGKRTKERESVHYAATLDNLINLSSQDCLALKPMSEAVEEEPAVEAEAASPLPEVVGVYTDERSDNALTTVFLKIGTAVVSGMHHRAGKPPLESIAIATGKALERVFPGVSLQIREVVMTGESGDQIVTATGELVRDDTTLPTEGTRKVEKDAFTAAAEATINAVTSNYSFA